MNAFIKNCRAVFANKPRIIVIGNESCDLDSAVCSISLAFHLSKHPNLIKSTEGSDRVLPVLNVSREDLPLKTEVVHFLRENRINPDDLLCKDEIDLPETSSDTKFVLVDHHLSKYRLNVIGVVDHRPFDTNSQLSEGIFKFIEQVGSCATLITKMIADSNTLNETNEANMDLLKLLYGPIILDTVNFSKEADKARELDHQMAQLIERYLSIAEYAEHRQQLFNNLVAKRSDVSGLNSLQILSKDLKIVSRNQRTVAIPGYPILVQDYIKLDSAEPNLRVFAEKTGSNVVVMMGMKVNPVDGSVRRDLGIINVNDLDLFEKIVDKITSYTSPSFCLKPVNAEFLKGKVFEQENIKASRKQLLPLINEVLN